MIHQRQPVNQESEVYTPYLRDVQQAICRQFPIGSKDLHTLLTVDKQHNSIVCEIYRTNMKSILDNYANWESPLNGIISSFIADYPNSLVLNSEIVSNIQRLITETIQDSGVPCQNRHLSVENVASMNQALEDFNLTTMWVLIRGELEHVIVKLAEDASAKDISTWMDLNQNHLQDIKCLILSSDCLNRPLTGIPKEIALLIKLEELSFSENRISYLPPEIFNKLTNLQDLDLSSNKISNLHPETFNELINLKELYLHNNEISNLPPETFNKLNNLNILNLSENEISNLPSETFDKLTNLKGLSLGNNKISNLPLETFNKLINLKRLDLGNNKISNLPLETFNKLINLKGLRLSYNEISNLHSATFNKLINLRELYLDNNQISNLPSEIFNEITLLEILDLSDNKISGLPKCIFDKLTKLQILNMGANQIMHFSFETVSYFNRIDTARNPQLLYTC